MYTDKQIKEVFVFGAGASNASARTPLGRNLGWTYYEDCSTWYEIENGKPANHDLRERNTRFVNYGKFLQLVCDVYPGLNEFKRWQECMKNGADYYFLAEKDKYVDEMIKILQERRNKEEIEIVRQVVFEHITESSKGIRNSLYEEFVKRLTGKSSEIISIISFNFDYLLEEDFRSEMKFDYLIPFDEIEIRDWYNKKNAIPLIKLNGSLNWTICPKCRRVTLIFPSLSRDPYDNRPCNKGCSGELRPYIFLPHEGKDKLVSPLWEKAREVLKQASKITVIGYSFPSYDKDVINLFKEYTNNDAMLEIVDYAEHADKNNKEKEIKEKEIREILKNIFPLKKDIEIFLCGFEGYIKEIQMQ